MVSLLCKCICVLSLLLLCTGCWSRRELNELGIAVGIGIDRQGDKFAITAQVVDPGAIASKGNSINYVPAITLKSDANTIEEGFRRMTTVSARTVYLAHLRVLVLSEDLARSGIKDVLDFFSRSPDVRPDFYVVVAKNAQARDVLGVLTPLEKIPANRLYQSLKMSEHTWAPTLGVHMDDLINNMVTAGREAVLTGLEIKGNAEAAKQFQQMRRTDQPALLKYSTLGVFKKDKLVGWLDEIDSKGMNYIENKVKSTVGYVPCSPEGNTGAEIIERESKVQATIVNGKPRIDIMMRAEANMEETACNIDLSKAQNFHKFEKDLNQKVIQIMESSIHTAQKKYNADIFGFGQAVHRADPVLWERLKPNWDKEFANLPVSVHAEIKLRTTGTVAGSFLTDLEKEK
ncbi:MAG: Ger(x)C family spore germination protein [Tumebacillaceae bacterium]